MMHENPPKEDSVTKYRTLRVTDYEHRILKHYSGRSGMSLLSTLRMILEDYLILRGDMSADDRLSDTTFVELTPVSAHAARIRSGEALHSPTPAAPRTLGAAPKHQTTYEGAHTGEDSQLPTLRRMDADDPNGFKAFRKQVEEYKEANPEGEDMAAKALALFPPEAQRSILGDAYVEPDEDKEEDKKSKEEREGAGDEVDYDSEDVDFTDTLEQFRRLRDS